MTQDHDRPQVVSVLKSARPQGADRLDERLDHRGPGPSGFVQPHRHIPADELAAQVVQGLLARRAAWAAPVRQATLIGQEVRVAERL